MKILIVNGYNPGSAGDAKFNNFVKSVKSGFRKHKAKSSNEFEYVIRDRTNIDEFLFEAFSKYSSTEAQ